jgi:hypothetical protein
MVIATGGFSRLFSDVKIFDAEIPNLVLYGLYLAIQLNDEESPQKGAR